MVASYGETSGFTAVNETELALVNGGKGGGGGGGGGGSGRTNSGSSFSPTAGYSTGEKTPGSTSGSLSPGYYGGGNYVGVTNNSGSKAGVSVGGNPVGPGGAIMGSDGTTTIIGGISVSWGENGPMIDSLTIGAKYEF